MRCVATRGGSLSRDTDRGGGRDKGGRGDKRGGKDKRGGRDKRRGGDRGHGSPHDHLGRGSRGPTTSSRPPHDNSPISIGHGGGRFPHSVPSQTGQGDAMDDLDDVLQQRTPREIGIFPDDDYESIDDGAQDYIGMHDSNVTEQTPTFGNHKVHAQIRKIIIQFLDGPWISSKMIPDHVVEQMFSCFRIYYQWNELDDCVMRVGFKNALKERFRDWIRDCRDISVVLANKGGNRIPPKQYNFQIMRNFNPPSIHLDLWQKMCDIHWNTDTWKKRSESGRSNRNSSNNRHTGGSITFHEHRIKLKQLLGREPTIKKMHKKIHLKADSKKKFLDGELDTDEGLEWVSERSRVSLEAYEEGMIEKYGDDTTQHPGDDAEVWIQRQGGKKKGRVFGIGSSDPYFLVSGTSSSASGCGLSAYDYAQSQQQVRDLQESQKALQNEMERERKAREALQATVEEFMRQIGKQPPTHPESHLTRSSST